MPQQEPSLRRTYLLRIWEGQSSARDRRALRFILQEVRSGQREGFGSLDALVAYLRAHLDLDADENGHRSATPAAPGGADQPDLPPA
jgi:hypothetical protein